MDPRTPRFANPKTLNGPRAVFRVVAVGFLVLSAAGFSRPSSRALELPRRFDLIVRETRDDVFHDASTDSVVTRRFASSLTHCGRIERAERRTHAARAGRSRDAEKPIYAVHTDSLLFVSDAPFRYTALIRRDTVVVTSLERGSSTRTGALDVDREMLACIFEGPALLVTTHGKDGSIQLQDLNAQCTGGLYRRLNLPVTLGAFVFPIPSGRERPGERWETTATCPSFSGLGLFPRLNLTYEVVEKTGTQGTTEGVEIACDTTLVNVHTVTPGGDAVDIISARIRVRGVFRRWRDVPLLHTGEFRIEEDIRYARPGLESPVSERRGRVEILLEPR